MRRRGRNNGKGSLGRDFAPLYEPVLRAEAVRTLPLADFKYFMVLTALCKPWNNGAVPLARSVLQGFGLISSDTTNRAIGNLLERGLIVRTRTARPRHAALYGVSHLPLNIEAMNKVGARDPGSTPSAPRTETEPETPSDSRTEISVRSADRESPHHRTELTPKQPDSVRPSDRIRPISTPNSVRPPDTSKNLPSGTGPNGSSTVRADDGPSAADGSVQALLDRVRTAGASVTTDGSGIRIRQGNGELPADLVGELRVRQKEIYRFLMNGGGHDSAA